MLYPWVKIHGPIEASAMVTKPPGLIRYPWVKIHGPIEAIHPVAIT